MNSKISDTALDLGEYALDYELENGEIFEIYSAKPAEGAFVELCSFAA